MKKMSPNIHQVHFSAGCNLILPLFTSGSPIVMKKMSMESNKICKPTMNAPQRTLSSQNTSSQKKKSITLKEQMAFSPKKRKIFASARCNEKEGRWKKKKETYKNLEIDEEMNDDEVKMSNYKQTAYNQNITNHLQKCTNKIDRKYSQNKKSTSQQGNKNSIPQQQITNSAVSKISCNVKSLQNEVNHLKQEVAAVKQNNNRLSSQLASSFGTITFEEINPQLKREVLDLKKTVFKIKKEVNDAKSSLKAKDKEKLMKEIENLEKSIKDAKKLRRTNNMKYEEEKNKLNGRDPRMHTRFSATAKMVDDYTSSVRESEKELQQIENAPKPQRPNHDETHEYKRCVIRKEKCDLANVQKQNDDLKSFIEKTKVLIYERQKVKHGLTAAVKDLDSKIKDVFSNCPPPIEENEEQTFFNELTEHEKSVRVKAEKQFEAEFPFKSDEIRKSTSNDYDLKLYSTLTRQFLPLTSMYRLPGRRLFEFEYENAVPPKEPNISFSNSRQKKVVK